jgi:hypothetical protein
MRVLLLLWLVRMLRLLESTGSLQTYHRQAKLV